MTRHTGRIVPAALLLTLVLAACGRENSLSGESPSPSAPAATSPAPTPAPAGSTPTASPGSMVVPAYYLGDTQNGVRLYREFRSVPRSAGVARAAVEAMLHLAPLDPDYKSLWPRATQVRNVTIAGDLATVDLSREATGGSAGAEAEAMSVQQLVHTVTAAAPVVHRVQLLVDGAKVETLWGHADVRSPTARANRLNTLAAIWIIQPAYGTTVGRTFAFSGDATVFEGTVSWDVRTCTSPTNCTTAVRNGFTTTDGAPARAAWSVTVTLPASVATGSHVEVRAWEDSAQDGTPLFRDTKVLRVSG